MLARPPRTNPFTPACCRCRQGRGLPLGVSASDGQRTFTYRCDNCGVEWLQVVPASARLPRRTVRPAARVLGFNGDGAPPAHGGHDRARGRKD